jgi:hypothetical protein
LFFSGCATSAAGAGKPNSIPCRRVLECERFR